MNIHIKVSRTYEHIRSWKIDISHCKWIRTTITPSKTSFTTSKQFRVMFLVHFQQQKSKFCTLPGQLVECTNWLAELVAFSLGLVESSPWTRRVPWADSKKSNFNTILHQVLTNKPRVWYHWWVLSILTLPKCTCNPNNLGSMFV